MEWVFRTLKDRLVHEMRLAGIKTLEETNRILEGSLVKGRGRAFVLMKPSLTLRR